MRLKSEHAKFVADKISIELLNSGLVHITQGLETVSAAAETILREDIEIEKEINNEAMALIDTQDDDIEFYQADRKQLAWMIKRKIAAEKGFSFNWEERISDIAHHILDELYEEDLINYTISENRIKNMIFKAIDDYLKRQSDIEDTVYQKITTYKRHIPYGSEEYDIIFNKLYEEELRKLGL
jgi:hypothetical protein